MKDYHVTWGEIGLSRGQGGGSVGRTKGGKGFRQYENQKTTYQVLEQVANFWVT